MLISLRLPRSLSLSYGPCWLLLSGPMLLPAPVLGAAGVEVLLSPKKRN